MPKGSHIGGSEPLALLYMAIVFAAALLVPALLYRFSSSHGPSDSDTGEDGGGGPRRPPPAPSNDPPGGVPLDDARPAGFRLRDDRRLTERLPRRQRQTPCKPARSPARRSPTTEGTNGRPRR